MFRAVLLCVAVLWAGAAAAADQPRYAPPSAWVRPIPIPRTPVAGDGAPVQMLLSDEQSNFGPDEDEFYAERAMKILSPQGLNTFGTLSQIWDPDTETLVIHRLNIIRGDTVIDALAGGKKFVVLRRENNLELAMLDGRLTATIQPEGLQVGDVIDMALTIHRHDPALQGYSTDIERLSHTGIAGRVHVRALWPTSKPIRWRVTDGMGAPQIANGGAGVELVVDMDNVETPKPPIGAPPRFADLGSLELSQYADWAELSRMMASLYQKAAALAPGSALSAQVATIAAASSDPKMRTSAALRLVEEQTRYVFLGMNDGGLVPADAEATWSRRFGDCKGKTALLVAVLRALGIDAEPALVSTTFGDGMDARLPTSGWFDHVIVRAQIAGKTYWLDGTRVGDRNLDDLVVPPFRWALPIQSSGASLVRLDPAPLAEPGFEERINIDASKGPNVSAPAHIEITYRGEDAARQRQAQAARPRADYERYLREFWTKTYPWLDVQSVTATDVSAAGSPRLTADGFAKMDWIQSSDGSRFYRVPATAMGADVSFRREPGPHQDAPYAVAYPFYGKSTRQIILPADGDFLLVGADIDKTAAGMALQRRSRIENGVLSVEMSTRATEREFPAADADADGAALRELATSGVSVVYRGGGAGAQPRASRSALPGQADADLAAATRGDAAAQYRVAELYQQGRGVPLDPATAVAWLRKAADQDYPLADGALGTAYLVGAGVPRDQALGLTWLRKGADHGDALSEVNLATMFVNGAGVPRDDARAFFLAQRAAEQKYPGGEYLLALLYLDGKGTQKDPVQGLEWLREAADQGLAAAQTQLAAAYSVGRGTTIDYVQAATWFRKAADQGDPGAEAALGAMYQLGYGVGQDYAVAMTWFRKAVDRGEGGGALGIAQLYRNGLGAPKDPAKALEWVRKAADMGSARGQYELGYAYEHGLGLTQDSGQAMAWLTKAAAQGDAAAQNELRFIRAKGAGVARDDAQATAGYQQAALQNDARAQTNVGLRYLKGTGVPRDYQQAIAWFRKAAAQGFSDAQYDLGYVYARGLGVDRDEGKALEWYRKAADQDHPQAEAALGFAYLRGFGGAAKDSALALAWLRKGAAHGDPGAEAGLAEMYLRGEGVEKDPVKAVNWLTQAAYQGYAPAMVMLGDTYRSGVGSAQNYGQALIWYRKAADLGESSGEAGVGIMYWKALGVPRDFVQALVWLRKAAQQGNVYAERFLGLAYLNGLGVAVDRAQAETWFGAAAAQGDAFSVQQVAFLRGKGPPPGLAPDKVS